MTLFVISDNFIFLSVFILYMEVGGVNTGGSELQTTTLQYLQVSENSKVRQVLQFFKNYPKTIVVETSRMGNPYYIISKLAELKVDGLDFSKKRDLKFLRDRFVAGILFWAGIREGELVQTRKQDIDLISRTYNVPTLKQRKKSKQVVYRPIPLTHVPNEELRVWNKYFEVMRLSGDDKVADMSTRTVERITSKLLGYNPHALRHGLGLFLYELTNDIRLVSQVLRHTNISNTMIYTRLSLEGMREKLELK